MIISDRLWIALIIAAAFSCPQARAEDPVSSGTITNRGRLTPDVAPDPAHPSYQRQVRNLIGKEWSQMIKSHVGEFAGKLVRLQIAIAPSGKVDSLKVLHSDDDHFAELSKQAILVCHFPPIPPESVGEMKEGHFEMDLNFIIY